MIDEKGRLKLSSTARLPPDYDFGDRDFFLMHRDNPDLGIKMSAPYYQTLDGDALIVLSRRVNHPDGSFAGVVAGAMRLKYVEQLFRGIKIDNGMWITLLMTDGTIIARAPHHPGDLGHNLKNAPIMQAFRSCPRGAIRSRRACRGLKRGSTSISKSANAAVAQRERAQSPCSGRLVA